MSSLVYPQCLRKLYASEANGEKIYGALLKVAKTERHRRHFATLLQLETETKARLQPFLFGHGVEPFARDIQPLIDGAVALYREQGWHALMAGTRPVVLKGIAEFEAIAALGPAEDAEILASMARHENAILSWAEAKLAGKEEGSLAAVNAELVHAIPAGAGV